MSFFNKIFGGGAPDNKQQPKGQPPKPKEDTNDVKKLKI